MKMMVINKNKSYKIETKKTHKTNKRKNMAMKAMPAHQHKFFLLMTK